MFFCFLHLTLICFGQIIREKRAEAETLKSQGLYIPSELQLVVDKYEKHKVHRRDSMREKMHKKNQRIPHQKKPPLPLSTLSRLPLCHSLRIPRLGHRHLTTDFPLPLCILLITPHLVPLCQPPHCQYHASLDL